MKKRTLKRRNPLAQVVRTIRPKMVQDKREKRAQQEFAKIIRRIHRDYPGLDV